MSDKELLCAIPPEGQLYIWSFEGVIGFPVVPVETKFGDTMLTVLVEHELPKALGWTNYMADFANSVGKKAELRRYTFAEIIARQP